METRNGRKKTGFRAACRPGQTPLYVRPSSPPWNMDAGGQHGYQALNALIFRLFCSLRLSVRTPPFHGGESGSIPLGSANGFNDLPPRPLRRPANGPKCASRGSAHAHHGTDTFKAHGDHFQGLREPFSQPRFHPLRSPENRHQRIRMRERKMETAAIAITTCFALYLVLRLTLRVYFPPDT